MIVRSGSTRARGMGRPYWEVPGGFMPIETLARENNAARPSEALIAKVQADRMRQITGGAVQNYQGAGLRATDLPTVRWMAGARPASKPAARPAAARTPVPGRAFNPPAVRRGMRGLGDCLIAAQSEGYCPDGSEYMGTLDSGGAAPSGGGGFSFPWFTSKPAPAAPAAAPSSGSSDWAKLAASVLPASFTVLQEAIAQPGQVVKTPTTLVTGSGANVASIPGLSTASNSGLLIIGAVVVVGGLLIFGSKKR